MHQSEGKNFPSTSNLFYFSYIIKGSTKRLKKCIAEVTNAPWGERVSFVFDPHSDLVAKALHVCPFMVANYAFFFTAFRELVYTVLQLPFGVHLPELNIESICTAV
ncbi:hypothetical protein JHK87_022837 [Glycine soja]|nr:hypothetical protein JHK87_022837 [Glycine soja]